MPQCIVIADDLTGANATGVQLKQNGFNTSTVLTFEGLDHNQTEACTCLIYPTDSRAVSPEEAYARVSQALARLGEPGVALYSKRIDSTLRGNLGAETDAMLDYLGEDVIAAVAPCFPSSGRIVLGGFMLVNGIPLYQTAAAADPKAPVHSSELKKIIDEQTRYQTAWVSYSEIEAGGDALAERVKALLLEGARILCFDCVRQEDLEKIADTLVDNGIRFIAVDPGVFTGIAARRFITPDKSDKKVLSVVGSVNPVAAEQAEVFRLKHPENVNIFTISEEFLADPSRRLAEISRVVAEAEHAFATANSVSVVTDGIYPENKIDLLQYVARNDSSIEEESAKINHAFAEIAVRLLASSAGITGLYTSGGDITAAVCERGKAGGLTLLDEILPLAAHGKFMSGAFAGLDIITKGGMVGTPDAMNTCVEFLLK